MNQIDALNAYVKTKLAPSEIDGVGVFALRDIGKDEKLYADIQPFAFQTAPGKLKKDLFPEVYELLVSQWPKLTKGEPFFYPTTRFVAFMNHSDEPNYNAETDTVLKDIKRGEEITEDYRNIDVDLSVFPFIES